MPDSELNDLVTTLRDVNTRRSSEMNRVLELLQQQLEGKRMKPGEILTELLLEAAQESLKVIVELKTGIDDPEIIFAGSDLCDLLGYMKEELIGKPLTVLVPDDSKVTHRAEILKYTDNSQERRMGEGKKLAARRKNGVLIPVAILLKPKSKYDPTVEGKTRYFVIATVMPLEIQKAANENQ